MTGAPAFLATCRTTRGGDERPAITDRFENDEIEILLTEFQGSTGRTREDVLLDALRKEHSRRDDDLERRIAEGLRIDEEFRRRVNARPVIDPRSPDEILGYDENGLPT